MATRTVQILGLAYGSSPATVTATANGTQIFDGFVTTVDQSIPSLPNLSLPPDQNILFTFEIDTAFLGNIPMTCTVNSGTVIFGAIQANYSTIPNSAYTQEQVDIITNPDSTRSQKIEVYTAVANPPFSAEEIALLENTSTPQATFVQILTDHNCGLQINSGPSTFAPIDNTDPRANVQIDGVAQTPDHSELAGTWWWTIDQGSTLSFDLQVDPVIE